MPIPLRPNISALEGLQGLQGVLLDLETVWGERSAPILADILSGKVTLDEGTALLGEVVEDLEEMARDRLVSALDAAWDFSAAPDGPLGLLLEGMDSLAWEGLLEVVGSVAAPLVVWVRDLLTLDEMEKEGRAQKLLARAVALEQQADAADEGRADRLRARARRKRERAQRLRE